VKKYTQNNSGQIPWFELIFTGLGSCVILFVIAPLISMVIATSFTDLAEAAADRQVMRSIKLTLTAALLATAASVLVGIPLAYLLARKKFWGRSILLAIIDLPIIIPHTAAGIALLTVIGRQSILGRLLGTGLTGTVAGISVAMAFVSLPFLIHSALQAFISVPVRLENIARTLGASPSYTFFTISLPLSWRGIISGMILMWARGISEFGAVIIIAYHPMTTPVMVFQRFNDYGLAYARSVAVLLILICVSLFVILRLISNPKNGRSNNA
jgi:molybdate/tungstate transport system permease protein